MTNNLINKRNFSGLLCELPITSEGSHSKIDDLDERKRYDFRLNVGGKDVYIRSGTTKTNICRSLVKRGIYGTNSLTLRGAEVFVEEVK